MASPLTTIFGGNPESGNFEQPASTINDRPEEGEGADGGNDGAKSLQQQAQDDDGAGAGGPLGPPSGQPEPFSVDGGPLGPPSGQPEPYDAGF